MNSPLRDGTGSTTALTDSNGTISSEYTYDAYGTTASTGGSSSNSSQYTGARTTARGFITTEPDTIRRNYSASSVKTR